MKDISTRGAIGRLAATTCVAAIAVAWSVTAQAQTAPANETTGEEVVVKGLRASIARALDDKMASVNVVDVISAEDIGKFPDTNLSESLQRIPGITISRSETGEGKQINLRGLGPEFSTTEINGGSGISGFDFTVLPPELFQRIVVEKSPTARTVEGALAGVIRAETPKPFDHGAGIRVVGSAGVAVGENGHAVPRLFGLASINVDDRFGVALAATYSKSHFESSQISHGSWVPFRNVASATALASAPQALLDAASPRTTGYYSYVEDRTNYALSGAAQARLSDRFDVTLDLLYGNSKGARTDDRPDAPLEGNIDAPTNYVISHGAITSGTFTGIQNRVGTSYKPGSQNVFQGVLRANWQPADNWKVSPSYSHADYKITNVLNLYSFAINGANLTYKGNSDIPQFTSTATDFRNDPKKFGFNVLYFDRFAMRIKEDVWAVDVTRAGDSSLKAINFGARYADRTNTTEGASSILVGTAPTVAGLADSTLGGVSRLRDFHLRGASSTVPSQILAVDVVAARRLYHPNTDGFQDGTDFIVFDHGEVRNFSVSEKTAAGYFSLDFDFDALLFNAGLRVVQTKTLAIGNQLVGGVITPRRVNNQYTDFLPSMNLRYSVMDKGYLRASYSRTITRPSLFDLRPSQTIEPGPKTGARGNPLLQPYKTDQGDLGFEYYFHNAALFQVTGFVKQINTLITTQTVDEMATFPDQLTGQPVTDLVSFSQPANGDRATVKGVEVGLTTPFYFLGAGFERFGLTANYTYADSKATTRAANGSSRTTPLPGLSKHSLTTALYYDHNGFDARLAYTYRNSYLRNDAVGTQFGAERYIRGYGQLDFSMNVPIMRNFSLSFDALNLLDAQTKEYSLIAGGAKLPSNITEKERIFMATARASF